MRRFWMAALLYLLPCAAAAQSATVLLQKGIFLEETAGDLDGAIQAYRQISTGPFAAEAKSRLDACLSRKRSPAATKEMLVTSKMTIGATPAGTPHTDPDLGYSFTLPHGWSFKTRPPYSGGPGNCTDFEEPEHQFIARICAKPVATGSRDIERKLREGLAGHIADFRNGQYRDYALRAGSPTLSHFGSWPALSIVADFHQRSAAIVESTTWVQSETTRASIGFTVPAAEFDAASARFAPLLDSFRIP